MHFTRFTLSLQAKKKKTMAIEDAIFRRSELLLGNEAMERIAQKRVIIFGVGGVGSWCAESLENRGCPIDEGEEPSPFNKPQTNGSLAHITAIFGFTLAGLVIQDIEYVKVNATPHSD